VNEIPYTRVKNQFETGTCWSFSGISFLESELIRQGKGIYDLSELYAIRFNYIRKAELYIKMRGNASFPLGGEANDVTQMIDIYGMVPESVYPWTEKNLALREDEEMNKELKSYIDSILKDAEIKIYINWKRGYEEILDRYMSPVPQEFSYKGIDYTPISFANSLNLSSDNYILVTSFINEPFYKPFILEVPDNWSWEEAMNVPLAELVCIIDSAIIRGYSVAWALDITEKGFSFSRGVAYYPESINRSVASNNKEIVNTPLNFDLNNPEKEIILTEEMRQEAFDNCSTTDDHLMHIVGSATNYEGQKYYYVKNSWGTKNKFKGFVFASEIYLKYKTISIMINKEAIPQSIAEKFNY